MTDDLIARATRSIGDAYRLQSMGATAFYPHNLMTELLAEVERLHSWDGLMSLLDEHWPESIFPTLPDDSGRDPGPRIVSLLRWVEHLQGLQRDDRQNAINAIEERDQALAEVERLRGALDGLAEVWMVAYEDEGGDRGGGPTAYAYRDCADELRAVLRGDQ